jgi:hypothetical protein
MKFESKLITYLSIKNELDVWLNQLLLLNPLDRRRFEIKGEQQTSPEINLL